MRSIFLRATFLLFVIMNLLVLCNSKMGIANVTKVAFLPFQVNAEEDIEYINEGIRKMLVSRITYGAHIVVIEQNLVKDALSNDLPGQLTKEKVQKIGNTLGAGYVIFGSISKIGNNLSIDVNVLNVLKGGVAIPVFVQSVGLEEVIPKMVKLAGEIRDAISTGFKSLPSETTTIQPAEKSEIFPKEDLKTGEITPGKIEEVDLAESDSELEETGSPSDEEIPEMKRESESLEEQPSGQEEGLVKDLLKRSSEIDSLDENPVYQKSVNDLEKIPEVEQKK